MPAMLLTSNTAKSYPFEAIGVPNHLPDLVAINKEFRNEPLRKMAYVYPNL